MMDAKTAESALALIFGVGKAFAEAFKEVCSDENSAKNNVSAAEKFNLKTEETSEEDENPKTESTKSEKFAYFMSEDNLNTNYSFVAERLNALTFSNRINNNFTSTELVFDFPGFEVNLSWDADHDRFEGDIESANRSVSCYWDEIENCFKSDAYRNDDILKAVYNGDDLLECEESADGGRLSEENCDPDEYVPQTEYVYDEEGNLIQPGIIPDVEAYFDNPDANKKTYSSFSAKLHDELNNKMQQESSELLPTMLTAMDRVFQYKMYEVINEEGEGEINEISFDLEDVKAVSPKPINCFWCVMSKQALAEAIKNHYGFAHVELDYSNKKHKVYCTLV